MEPGAGVRADSSETQQPSKKPANADLVIWALHLLGGATRLVDVEEIFFECFRLAPSRFAWRTRADMPDYKKCSKALRDADAGIRAGLLAQQGRYFRKLTVAGVEWCSRWDVELSALYCGVTPVRGTSVGAQERILREIRAHDAFATWRQEALFVGGLADLADVFQCSSTSAIETWQLRFDEAEIHARNARDQEVEQFIGAARDHWKQFGGGAG